MVILSISPLMGQEKKPIMKTVTELTVDERLYSILSALLVDVHESYNGYFDKFIWKIYLYEKCERNLIFVTPDSIYPFKDDEYLGYFYIDKWLFFCMRLDNSFGLLEPTEKQYTFIFRLYQEYPFVGGTPEWVYEYLHGEILFVVRIDSE